MLLHELDELCIALKLPIGLDQGLISDGEVHLFQLFLELDQRLVTVQQKDRALFDWDVIATNQEGLTSCNVFCKSPSGHGFTVTTSAIYQDDRRMRQDIRDQVITFGIQLHQLFNGHQVLSFFVRQLIDD